MNFTKLSISEFLTKCAGKRIRAKKLQALTLLPSNQIPVCAMFFSDEIQSFLIFNRLSVEGQWDQVNFCEISGDIFETIVLSSPRISYDELELEKDQNFLAKWPEGSAKFGPVKIEQISKNGNIDTFQTNSAKVHYENYFGTNYGFLIEMLFVTATMTWRLAPIPNFPFFFSFDEENEEL